ncbi:MAG: hypothetical protein WAV41_03320 [Microgenomates group bacterium]
MIEWAMCSECKIITPSIEKVVGEFQVALEQNKPCHTREKMDVLFSDLDLLDDMSLRRLAEETEKQIGVKVRFINGKIDS